MELDWIERLRSQLPQHPQMVLGAGDDASLLTVSPHRQLVATTDLLAEGTHFTQDDTWPRIGRKALAVNLSDLAAMAAKPVAALVSLLLPKDNSDSIASALYQGLLPLAADFGVAVAGGDFNTWDGPTVINVALYGEVEPGKAWRRSGALPGDALLVTGPLGGSLAGHHLDFSPRVREALWIAEHYPVHAAMDISDGFALDLHRLLGESKVGAEIESSSIPITKAASDMAMRQPNKSPLEHALSDGEDFELLLAMERSAAEQLVNDPQAPVRCTILGSCHAAAGRAWLVEGNGAKRLLQPQGYVH